MIANKIIRALTQNLDSIGIGVVTPEEDDTIGTFLKRYFESEQSEFRILAGSLKTDAEYLFVYDNDIIQFDEAADIAIKDANGSLVLLYEIE